MLRSATNSEASRCSKGGGSTLCEHDVAGGAGDVLDLRALNGSTCGGSIRARAPKHSVGACGDIASPSVALWHCLGDNCGSGCMV